MKFASENEINLDENPSCIESITVASGRDANQYENFRKELREGRSVSNRRLILCFILFSATVFIASVITAVGVSYAILKTNPTLDCPAGFTYFKDIDRCYGINANPLNWATARLECALKGRGFDLATIENRQQDVAIISLLGNISRTGTIYRICHLNRHQAQFWLGGQKINTSDCESNFVWKPYRGPSSPLPYSSFFSGEPNCANKTEFCLSVFYNFGPEAFGKWNDVPCSGYNSCAICEYSRN